MPQVSLLLYGAALAAPLALFVILIWTSLERRLELAAKERLVRRRIMRPHAMPNPALTLVIAAPVAAAPRQRARTAA
jgi:hypothetical protein